MTINGISYSSPKNINLRGVSSIKGSTLRFEKTSSTSPFDNKSNGLYTNSSNQLVFSSQGSATVVGAAGGGTVSTWDTIYDNDPILDIDNGTLTFLVSTNTAGLTLNKSAIGAGTVLAITNAGTGNDIGNTVASWYIKRSAATGILELGSTGTINATDGALTIGSSATATTFAGSATIVKTVTITGTAASAAFTVTAGDLVVSDGSLTLTDADEAASITIVNDTVASAILIDVNADGITDGVMLHLDSLAAGMTTGKFIECFDGAAAAFTVGLYGATVIAGNAATNVFTITAGDVVLSDTSITLTDADNAATLSVTNNTATTASVFVLAGSGVFTGSTTASFLTLTPSGLTSGTAVYIPTAALTTGKALHIVGNAISTGNLIHATSTSAVIAAGELATISLATSGGTIIAKTGALVSIASSRTETAAAATADDYDAVSIIRTNITATLGTMTAAGSALYVGVVNTQTAGTLTATLNGIEISYPAIGTGNALKITDLNATTKAAVLITASGATSTGTLTVTNTALTEGTILKLNAVEGTLTSGKYIDCYDGTASDFSISKYGATVIAGNAAGTAALTLTAGDLVVTAGYLKASAGGIQCAAVARTATADGTTTGTVANGTTYVTVTSAGVNDIIILPAPTPGNVVWLYIGATGYELRSSDPATIAINGGSGAGAESAIAASVLVRMVCTSATTWVGTQFVAAGTESAVQVAAA